MKLTILTVILLISVVSGKSLRHNTKNVGIAPVPTAVSGYAGGTWTASANCIFFLENDCQLSIHAAGRRMDATAHRANEDVLVSCLSAEPTLDLIIHGFTYDDIQDYTCLEDSTGESANFWLAATPVIEATTPLVHGQPTTLTCNAPPGSPLYWVLPGPAENHVGAIITQSSNAENESSSITFTLQDTDHFTTYNCCINAKGGQPYLSTCSSYYINDNDRDGSIEVIADYSSIIFDLKATVISNPLVDENSVRWYRCSSFGTCNIILPANFIDELDPSTNTFTSRMVISDDTFYYFYNFSVSTTDGVDQYTNLFTVSRGFFYPAITRLPTQIFYNPDTSETQVILKCTIDASPEPTVNIFRQKTLESSNGTEPVTTGGNYAVDVSQVSSTQWEATLIIGKYDSFVDDAVYTIVAENDVGKSSLNVDAVIGPNSLSLDQNGSGTDPYSFTCTFQYMYFPGPAAYEINVISEYDNNYSVISTTFDSVTTQAMLDIEVTIDPLNTYFVISCGAFNSYDDTKFRSQSLTINV